MPHTEDAGVYRHDPQLAPLVDQEEVGEQEAEPLHPSAISYDSLHPRLAILGTDRVEQLDSSVLHVRVLECEEVLSEVKGHFDLLLSRSKTRSPRHLRLPPTVNRVEGQVLAAIRPKVDVLLRVDLIMSIEILECT